MGDINIADDDEEESLSLCDFPLDFDTSNNPGNDGNSFPGLAAALSRRSSTEASSEFFEFLSDLSSDMCPADDIIFCGKLIPLNDRPRKSNVLRKRSESLCELRSESITRSDSTKEYTALLGNIRSRSLDCKKLRRYDMERNPSTRSTGKSEVTAAKKAIKRRWYVFMFGMVTFPPGMELKDIKSRQFRRNPSTMFPTAEDGDKKLTGNRSSGKGSSWNLLKALSCRDHSSVAVATPLWMPQA